MFRSNLIAMMSGTVIAQALPIMLSPLLARLFGPEAFGLQSLLMGVISILGVMSTLRLDLAIVLAESLAELKMLLRIVGVCTSFIFILVVVCLTLGGEEIAGLTGFEHALFTLWLTPPLLVATVAFSMQVGLYSRQGDLRPIALANVMNQLTYAVTSVAIGTATGASSGLAFSKVVGQSATSLWLLIRRADRGLPSASTHEAPSLNGMWQRYWKFVAFNTPYSLVSSVTRELPIIMFSSFGALPAAGFFGLARTVAFAPSILAANAFSPIFYRHAASGRGQPAFFQFTHTLVKAGLSVLAVPFAFCAVWGDVFFSFAFGSEWAEAGIYAMIMAPSAWLSTQTGWTERLAEANSRQGSTFAIQVISDAITVMTMVSAFLITESPIALVAAYAACNFVYQIVYLATLYNAGGFGVRSAVLLCFKYTLVFVIVCLVLFCLKIGLSTNYVSMLISAAISLLLSLVVALYWYFSSLRESWRKM